MGKVYVGQFPPKILEYRVLDIEELSTRYLEDRIGRMVAAKMAGLATKGLIAAGIGNATDNSDLGWLAFYVLALTDQADLRSWRTLPESLYMIRLPLPAGDYPVRLDVLSRSGIPMASHDFGVVTVKAKKKVFLIGR